MTAKSSPVTSRCRSRTVRPGSGKRISDVLSICGFEEVELRGIKAGEQKLAIRADCNVFKSISSVIGISITNGKRIMGGSYDV